MYEVNDFVVFGSTGVCQIVDIIQENFGGGEQREYFVLNPVYGNSSTIYIPRDNCEAKLRRIMTRAEIEELIKIMPDVDSEWIVDDQTRRAAFVDMAQSGDPEKLVRLIKVLFSRQEELVKEGKKLSNADTETMKIAETSLHNEIALVLEIQPDQVLPFILGQIEV